MKKETGFDVEDAKVRASEFANNANDSAMKGQAQLDRFRFELFPEFIEWNRWELWKVKFYSFLVLIMYYSVLAL